MAFPQQPGGFPPKPSDGTVDGYQRIVNGRVVKVNGYGKKGAADGSALKSVLKKPGRPRMAANPGNYASGRSIPGQKAIVKKAAPLPTEFGSR